MAASTLMANGLDDPKTIQWVDANPWPEPDLGFLGGGQREVPALPTGQIFSPATAGWIQHAAESVGAPADYVALGLLGAVTGICGAGVLVQATGQWSEPLVLWLAAIGAPSAGKTPALASARALLEAIERDKRSGDEDRLRQHKAREASAKLAHEAWLEEVEAAHGKGLPPPLPPADSEAPSPFIPTQCVIGDATLESIADVVSGNPRGVVSWHDELAGWLQSFSRYSNGSNRPAWLEGWSAGPARINRKSRREPLVLQKLPLSVIGTIQPDRLKEALAGADDGLPARFLYTWPLPVAFKSLSERRAPESDAMLQRMQHISSAVGTVEQPLTLRLAPDAFQLFDQFCAEHHAEAEDQAGLVSGWHGKGPGTILRLAGVLHLLGEAESGQEIGSIIEAETVRRAAGFWSDYFREHAKAAFSTAGLSDKERQLRRAVAWLQRRKSAEVTSRQIHKETFARTLPTDEVKSVADHLVKAAILRVPNRAGRTVGRPSTVWEVNPAIHQCEPPHA